MVAEREKKKRNKNISETLSTSPTNHGASVFHVANALPNNSVVFNAAWNNNNSNPEREQPVSEREYPNHMNPVTNDVDSIYSMSHIRSNTKDSTSAVLTPGIRNPDITPADIETALFPERADWEIPPPIGHLTSRQIESLKNLPWIKISIPDEILEDAYLVAAWKQKRLYDNEEKALAEKAAERLSSALEKYKKRNDMDYDALDEDDLRVDYKSASERFDFLDHFLNGGSFDFKSSYLYTKIQAKEWHNRLHWDNDVDK